MSSRIADIWVVAGPVGAGKTTVSDILLSKLKPTPALLDKDTMYGSFVTAILAAEGREVGEREGEWYDRHIKIHEYAGMTDTAREIRSKGCPVILSGPFTQQIRNKESWEYWVEQLGGENARLVWINTDAETLRKRLDDRGSERDTGKLANFDDFIKHMQPGEAPPVPHIAIDNRLSASRTLDEQIMNMLKDKQIYANY